MMMQQMKAKYAAYANGANTGTCRNSNNLCYDICIIIGAVLVTLLQITVTPMLGSHDLNYRFSRGHHL